MINLAVRAHHFKFYINAPFCYCLRELIPQPSGTSWISGGAPMVFQQPMSKVWGKEEAQQLLFRDFGDRLETWERCKLHFVNLLVQHNNTLKIFSGWSFGMPFTGKRRRINCQSFPRQSCSKRCPSGIGSIRAHEVGATDLRNSSQRHSKLLNKKMLRGCGAVRI